MSPTREVELQWVRRRIRLSDGSQPQPRWRNSVSVSGDVPTRSRLSSFVARLATLRPSGVISASVVPAIALVWHALHQPVALEPVDDVRDRRPVDLQPITHLARGNEPCRL